MKSKNVKVIDEHNIDRDASVMFALELDGSEYVVYWISRDEDSNNIFVSKVLKNIDGTYSMVNIDDEEKKKEIAEIVKTFISNSVSDQNEKLAGNTTTLSNGKVVSFVNVSFNKEQQISVAKTYITTVKKEVTKVAETYYDVVVEEAKVEPILSAAPSVDPVVDIFPEPVVATPVETTPVVEPAPVVAEPVNQGLVFNASKETNLNAALGEVANSTTIPVENIEPVREFGVEEPVVSAETAAPAPASIAPMVQPEMPTDPKVLTRAGFANSKFFMVVAIAFFMASCVFLGYEVYNYFQLVK